jgi:diguanylate cyclase (GGDEF)-like protein/PAS domain S-box-containing protein
MTLIHQEDLGAVSNARHALADGASGMARARVRAKDGTHRLMLMRARPLFDADGNVIGRVAGWRDITEHEEAQVSLTAERRRTAAALRSLLDPYMLLVTSPTVDGGMICQLANPAACTELGRTAPEVEGASLIELLPSGLADRVNSWCAQVLGTGEALAFDSLHVPDPPSGIPAHYDVRVSRVYEDSIGLTWRDVTDRQATVDELKASEERFRLLAHNSTDVVLTSDLDGTITWVSPSVLDTLGWEPADLVGRDGADLIHPVDRQRFDQEGAAAAVARGELLRFRFRIRRGDGGYTWVESLGQQTTEAADGGVFRVVSLRDIEDQQHALEELRRSEATFRTAMESSPVGMATEGVDLKFTNVNAALCRMLGVSAEELVGSSVLEIIDPQFHILDGQGRQELREGRRDSVVQEVEIVGADGIRMWAAHAVGAIRDAEGRLRGYVSQYADITDAKAARIALEMQASLDALTEVRNRRAVVAELEAAVGRERRAGYEVAVLFADLDDLKPVNDECGHGAGDELIIAVARRIREALRAGDVVGRFGGDEFVVVLHSVTDGPGALAAAEKIRCAVSEELTIAGVPMRPSISIGVGLVEPGDSATDALQRADRALYRAKKEGKDRVVLAPAGTGARGARERTRLTEDPLDG